MSLSGRRALTAVGLGAAAAALLASPAGAATKKLTYVCEYPLIGWEGLEADVTANIPDEWPINRQTAAWTINAATTTSVNTWEGVNTLGGSKIETVRNIPAVDPETGEPIIRDAFGIDATSFIELPGGSPTKVVPKLAITPYTLPITKRALKLNAAGTTPPLTLTRAGEGKITLGDLALNLRLLDSTGAPIDVSPKTDGDLNKDSDPFTFEVYCHIAGPTDVIKDADGIETDQFYPAQDNTLQSITLINAPTKPTKPTVTDITGTTANVAFGSSTLPNLASRTVAKYEFFDGATKIGETTGHAANLAAGSPRTAALTGLTPGKTYNLTVKAVENNGTTTSGSSEATSFVTPGGPVADTEKPTVPGKPSIRGGASGVQCNSIDIQWGASTDNVAVSKYVVRYDGEDYEFPGTTTQATLTEALAEDGEYYITVAAVDAAGNRSAASEALYVITPLCPVDPTPPSAPGALSLTDFSATSVTLSFGPATDNVGVVAYDVFTGENTTSDWIGGGTSSPVTVNELTTGRAYTLYVRARDAAGNRGPAQTINVTPRDKDVVKPSQPGAFTTADLTATGVKLTWGASTDNVGVTGYKVTYNGSSVETAGNVLTTTLSGLTPKTLYNVSIQARDLDGNWSDPRTGTVTTPDNPDLIKPSKPGTVTASDISNTAAKLTWGASTDNIGVTGYDVFNGTTKVGESTTTTATISGLSPNQSYTLTVKAKDAAGNVSDGTNVTFETPDTIAPTKPGAASATEITKSSAKITWGASTDAKGVTGYQLTYGSQTVNVAGNVLTTTLTALAEITDYTVTIKAKDAAGNLSEGTTVPFSTLDGTAPTTSTLTLGAVTGSSIALSWTAATDNKGVTGYEVFNNGTKIADATGTSTTLTGLSQATTYKLTVKAKDAAGNRSVASNEVTATTPDTVAPSKPSPVTATELKTTSAKITWGASTDNVGVTGYVLTYGSQTVNVAGNVLTTTLAGLSEITAYTVTVKAKDAAGNLSEGTPVSFTTPDGTAPSASTLTLGAVGDTTVALSWTAATDNKGVTGYEVYNNGTKIADAAGTSTTLTGLTQATTYNLTVKAKDAAGNLSAASNEVAATTTGSGILQYSYNLTGSSVLRTLSKGSVPLTGTVDSEWDTRTGAFTAELKLNPTRARLISLGIIPLTADIQFVQSGLTTGTLIGGTLKSNSKMKIRLPKVLMFGAIQIAGGTTCQTKRLTDISLSSSTGGFVAGTGGALSGTYSLSDLTGCGAFNGLLSPLTAGSGNTIAVNLTR